MQDNLCSIQLGVEKKMKQKNYLEEVKTDAVIYIVSYRKVKQHAQKSTATPSNINKCAVIEV